MTDTLTTTTQVIEAIGGSDRPEATRKIAALTGRNYNAALQWHYAETFPSNTYLVMTEALARIGKQAPAALWAMTAVESEREQATP